MGFLTSFHKPFRSTTPLASLGGVWDCAIDGRPFRFDRSSEGYQQGIQSLSILRTQSDTSDTPGQSSINREDSWRAGQNDWHMGAGQRYRDKEESLPERFYASQGIDVWTKDQISLLHDTALALATTQNNIQTVVAGGDMFVSDGTQIHRYDGDAWYFQNLGVNLSPPKPTAFATNGDTVWAVFDNGKSMFTNAALRAGTPELWEAWIPTANGVVYDNVAYARGRALVTEKQFIYEIQGANTPVKLNASEGNAAQRWTAITEGANAIFAAATTNGRSQIHRIVPPEDDLGGNLGVPIPAAPALPTGETISSLYGYLGQVVIGTNRGIRVAEEDGNGNLAIGALTELPRPVEALDGDGRYVWFSWSDFDGTATGIGRLDLGQQVDTGVYAYASDLMAETQGNVTAVASFLGRRFFAVQSHGLYEEQNTFVESGWLDSGQIRYGIIDDKVARRVELRHAKLSGSVSVELSVDQDAFQTLGVSSLEGTTTPTVAFESTLKAGAAHEVRLVLTRGASGTPVVQSMELRADPVPIRGVTIFAAVLLSDRDIYHDARHPLEDYEALVALANYKRAVTYQLKSKVFSVTIQDFQFIPTHETEDKRFENGTMILKLKAAA